MGGSCFASCTDNLTVLKSYEVWEDGQKRAWYPDPCEEALAREDFIYKYLGEHDQILRCFGLEEVHENVHALRLELAPFGNLRQFITEEADYQPSEYICLQMTVDVALGLSYLHSKKVQHSDLSCRNLFLFPEFKVKIGDLGGSLIEGHDFKETVYEEPSYELPSRGRALADQPVMKRELFALGSAIYEITAWKKPFDSLKWDEVKARYACEQFPSLSGNPAGRVIENCWNEVYESADEVIVALRKQMTCFEQPAKSK
ncbi:MAG: hypothetical protein Q9227_000711 [Pyrenula ochraceoflavens]